MSELALGWAVRINSSFSFASTFIGISLRQATDNDGNFDLVVNCKDNQSYSNCENATHIENGVMTNIDVSKAVNFINDDPWHREEVTWIFFWGSGGVDTIDFYAEHLINISNFNIFIDFHEDCNLSLDINWQRRWLSNENNQTKIILPTLQGIKYLVAFNEYHHYSQEIDSVEVILNQSTQPSCYIELEQDTFLVEYNRSIPINIFQGNTNGVRSASIKDATSGFPLNGNTISFNPKSEGYKIVQFDANDNSCWGHAYFYIKYINPPINELECPDSTIACQDDITHEDEDLSSNYFKSSSSITSNSYVDRQVKVVYMATEEIKLMEGFHARAGSNFTAMINSCTPDNELINQEQFNLTETTFEESQMNKELSTVRNIQLTTNPNPFLNQTILEYTLPELETISVSLYSLSGQKIKTILPKATQEAGLYNYSIDGQFLDTGIYILEVLTSNERIQKKIVKIQ